MLEPSNLHDYQRMAVLHQLMHDDSMLWLEMGLGKTPVTLTTIEHRMRAGQVKKTLVVGPLRVIHAVWEREARKWSHTKHLRFSVMHGTPKQRDRALFANADIYLINYENLNWLVEQLLHYYIDQGKPLPFQLVVYDEVSKLKNANSLRMSGGKRDRIDSKGRELEVVYHGWRKVLPHFKYRTGLTGSPASNGYLDLHGQYLAVDGGKRLGEYITHYKESFFESDYMGWGWTPTENGKQWIEHLISDITIKQDAKEYLDQQDPRINNIMVDLPPKARQQYQQIEADMFTQLDNGTEVEVFSRSSVSNKCLQFCNGGVYTDEHGNWEAVHDAKLDALEDILEEAAGKPVLVGYTFKPDAERIMKRFGKRFRGINMTGCSASATPQIIKDWNAGKYGLMVGHPASMGHGVDGLQDSGFILVWYGLNWSLELYTQMIARLNRQGQTKEVIMHRILCNDTLDLAVSDSLMRKDDDQAGLKRSIQRYRDGGITNELELSFI